jgi:glycosyltransferase involved in cell wall biosynthesis
VEFLIRSLAQRDDQSRSLVWVANDVNEALLAQLQGLARDLGVQVDIRIRVSDDELAELYRQAALFIYSPRLEPFGLAPLEAAASCLPTVAVAEAGTRETVVDGVTGLLVDRDAAEFSRAVDQVLGDADMFASLATEARSYVLERWRSVEAGKRLESALEQAIAVRDQE